MAHCNVKCWTVVANIIIYNKTTHAVIDVIATRWALVKNYSMTQTVILNSIFNSCNVLKKLMMVCATLEQFQVNNIHIKWSGS